MKKAVLFFLLLFSSGVFAEDCLQVELHPSLTVTKEGAFISVIVDCDGTVMKNKEVRIIYPSGKVEETQTNELGEVSLEASQEGQFLFEVMRTKGEPTETEVVYKPPEFNFSISRSGNSYLICSDEALPQVEILDNNSLTIIPTDKKNCIEYTTASQTFVVRARPDAEKEPIKVEAGKILSIRAPATVKQGDSFIVSIFDNSMPAQGARVSFMSQEKTTNSSGKVVFDASEPGEFEIKASIEGMREASEQVKVVKEFEELKVIMPEKTEPGKLIPVKVLHGNKPVENAVVELGGEKKSTNKEGMAFFSVAREGMVDVKVSKEGFSEFSKTLESRAEARPGLKIIAPKQAYAGDSIYITLRVGGVPVEGATVSLDEEEKESDSRGLVEFSSVKAGMHQIKASKKGFLPVSASIEVLNKRKRQTSQQPDLLLPAGLLAVGAITLVVGTRRFLKKRRAMM